VFSNSAAIGETKISHPSSSTSESSTTPATSTSSVVEPAMPADLVVAGALAVDFSCDFAPFSTATNQVDPLPHTSNPATITQSLGGVAHNIAKAAHLLGASVHLHSAVGQDLSGRAAVSQLEEEGMSVDGIAVLAKPARTAQYVAVNNVNKDLALAMADMSILETLPQHLCSRRELVIHGLAHLASGRTALFYNYHLRASLDCQSDSHLPAEILVNYRYLQCIPRATRRYHHTKHI
jgi:hypothetical protein